MRTCSACGYWKKSDKEENISFHMFPKQENIRQEWIKAIGKENFIPGKSSMLCSQHFEANCFYYPLGGTKQRIYLKSGSIPTIFNGRFSRKLKALSKQNVTNIKSNIEENNAIIRLGSECFEANTNKSNMDAEITSCTHDIAMGTCQIEVTDIYQEHPLEANTNMDTEITLCTDDIAMDSTCQIEATDIYQEHSATRKRKLIHQRNHRYIGDFAESDFQSPDKAIHCWKIAISTIKTLRQKVKNNTKTKRPFTK